MFTKEAAELSNTKDIIITAGILSRIKNKILSLFSREKRERVETMVSETDELKPKLVDTYNTIREIETAIEDLDVEKYEQTIEELNPKIIELERTVKKIKSLTNVKRKRTSYSSDYKDKYYIDDSLCRTLNHFASQFGVSLKYGVNIVSSRTGVKSLFTSWAANVFVGNKLRRKPTGQMSPGKFEEEHEDPKAFSDLQDQISEDQMIEAFYKNIPYYNIKKIEPRELRVVDVDKGRYSKQKPGEIEVFISSPWIRMPPPANNWTLKADFVLVDRGDPTAPGNFIIYRQWIVGAKKD